MSLDLEAAKLALYAARCRLESRLVAAHKAEDELSAALLKARAALDDLHKWSGIVEVGSARVSKLQDEHEQACDSVLPARTEWPE